MPVALLLLACAVPPVTEPSDDSDDTQADETEDDAEPEDSEPGDSEPDTDPADTETLDTDASDPSDSDVPPPCEEGMALVDDAFCVDRWEATLEVWDGAAWAPWSPYDALYGERVRAATPAAVR